MRRRADSTEERQEGGKGSGASRGSGREATIRRLLRPAGNIQLGTGRSLVNSDRNALIYLFIF